MDDSHFYTIKELAQIYKVTEQAVRKELKKDEYQPFLSQQMLKGRSTLVINNDGYTKLNQHFHKRVDAKKDLTETVKNQKQIIEHLSQELKDTKKNLDQTHIALINTQKALNHEQELHLIDKQEFSKLKAELTSTQKQLNMKNNVNNKDQGNNNNQSQNVVDVNQPNSKDTTQSKNGDSSDQDVNHYQNENTSKHWWQFWK